MDELGANRTQRSCDKFLLPRPTEFVDLVSVSRFLTADVLVGHALHASHHHLQNVVNSLRKLMADPCVRKERRVVESLKGVENDVWIIEEELRQGMLCCQTTSMDPAQCVVHEVIEKAIEVFMPYLRAHKVEVQLKSAAERDYVGIRSEALREILFALLINAVEAKARIVQIAAAHVSDLEVSHVCTLRQAIQIVVEDDGMGLATSDSEGIFEPTFTSKPEKFGKGLGLFVARSLARRAGGELSYVGKARGRGAAFRIALPPRWEE